VAGYLLAELVTGLVDEMLKLIAGARPPMTRSSAARSLNVRGRSCARWTITTSRCSGAPADRWRWRWDARRALGAHGRGGCDGAGVAAARPRCAHRGSATRPRLSAPDLDQLPGESILELEHCAYRASEIALYSSYQLPLPRRPHPGSDKRMRQIAAIG
jgi:hypothetical protein